MKYKIVIGRCTTELEDKVNKLIKIGYVVHGNMTLIYPEEGWYFFQTMLLPGESA